MDKLDYKTGLECHTPRGPAVLSRCGLGALADSVFVRIGKGEVDYKWGEVKLAGRRNWRYGR